MTNPIHKRVYLGDSVYAEFDGYHIVLTTDNGYGASNTIALEPDALTRLNTFRDNVSDKIAEIQDDS